MTAPEVWNEVTGEMAARLPQSNFDLWIKPIRAVAIEDDHLVCEAPATLFSWIERRYLPPLAELVRSVSTLDGIELCQAEEMAA